MRVPLAGDDPDVTLDLQAVFARAYEAGGYADRLHYDQPCTPSLRADDQTWADQRIAEARRAAEPALRNYLNDQASRRVYPAGFFPPGQARRLAPIGAQRSVAVPSK